MTKIKVILIALLILFLLGLVIFGIKKEEKQPKEIKMTEIISSPTPTLGTARKNGLSDTGARYISPTKKEKTEIDQIYELRKKSPVETDNFKISFSYKTNLFTVEFKNKEDVNNMENYDKWMKDNGYDNISDEYFEVKK